jgi:hypothetical protein
MELLPAVFMQRRIAPAEAFERGSTGCSPGCSTGCSSGRSRSNSPRSPRSQTQRHLRASRFADISTSRRCRYTNLELAPPILPMIAPLTLDAFALASALATQRLPLAPPRSRSLAAARCGVNGEPEGAGLVSRGCRPSGRPCGRPSGRPSGRLAPQPKGGFPAALRRLRALRFADISTSPKGRCMSSTCRSHPWPIELLAPFALGAIAIASALAPQRFSAEPRRRRSGAAWCDAVGGPVVACLAMARRGGSCQQTRRGRGRARSARVMAVHRKEADLDRFVAALLALACEPDGRGERRPGQPRARTGESSPTEQSCRR